MPIILPGVQHSPDWYVAKAGRITGTRFAAAMMDRKTQGHQQLICDLAWERVFGPDDPADRFMGKAMEHGLEYEPEAFAWYEFMADRPAHQPMFVVHGELPFVGVSPDLFLDPEGMAQIKCPQRRAHLMVMHTKKLPAEYRWQVLGELWVCERDWTDFVTYHPALRGYSLRVFPDDAAFKQLDAACRAVDEQANELAETIKRQRAAA